MNMTQFQGLPDEPTDQLIDRRIETVYIRCATQMLIALSPTDRIKREKSGKCQLKNTNPTYVRGAAPDAAPNAAPDALSR